MVTCKASEVLEHKHGICCAKAHLFAAVLRCLNIPVGFCYQWLKSDNSDHLLVIHGLNAIYLKDIRRWIRLDARGNKEGVNAQFSIDVEKLAWPVSEEFGEKDDPMVYLEPKKEVIQVLRSSRDRKELHQKWISVI
jgi:transglutaminase-like putative cysteine protease